MVLGGTSDLLFLHLVENELLPVPLKLSLSQSCDLVVPNNYACFCHSVVFVVVAVAVLALGGSGFATIIVGINFLFSFLLSLI